MERLRPWRLEPSGLLFLGLGHLGAVTWGSQQRPHTTSSRVWRGRGASLHPTLQRPPGFGLGREGSACFASPSPVESESRVVSPQPRQGLAGLCALGPFHPWPAEGAGEPRTRSGSGLGGQGAEGARFVPCGFQRLCPWPSAHVSFLSNLPTHKEVGGSHRPIWKVSPFATAPSPSTHQESPVQHRQV